MCVCQIYFGGFWDIILGGSGTFSNSMFHSEHFEYHKWGNIVLGIRYK